MGGLFSAEKTLTYTKQVPKASQMPNVILQPCGNPIAFRNLQRTISSDILIRDLRNFVSNPDWKKLKEIYTGGTCQIWGVEPKLGGNIKKWEKIASGDLAYFARKKKFVASGTVTLRMHNRELSLRLWGEGEAHSTWEYLYFLSDVQSMDAPLADFNVAMGYGAASPVRSFNVLDGVKGELALDYFGMKPLPESYFPTETTVSWEKVPPNLDRTDKEVIATQRLEHNYLKNSIHKGKPFNICAICHREFPVSFLVIAHIKRRSYCSDKDRVDKHVAMPLCNFGCDQLYERGYISIRGGTVVPLIRGPVSPPMQAYLDAVIGNECRYYSEDSQSFFEWHWDFHERRLKQIIIR